MCKAVRSLCISSHCRVELVKNVGDGALYVRREYFLDRTEILRRIKAMDSVNIPQYYVVEPLGHGGTLSLEEFIEGDTLLKLLEERRLSASDFESVAEQLIDAVGELHENGIVHMDIKPANIIFTKSGKLKLIDFGISKLYGESINAEDYLGTVGYSAPERYSNCISDFRTDIFSMGVTLEKAAEISGYRGGYCAAIKRCTQCEQSRRFQSIAQMKKYIITRKKMTAIVAAIGVAAALTAIIALIIIFL